MLGGKKGYKRVKNISEMSWTAHRVCSILKRLKHMVANDSTAQTVHFFGHEPQMLTKMHVRRSHHEIMELINPVNQSLAPETQKPTKPQLGEFPTTDGRDHFHKES